MPEPTATQLTDAQLTAIVGLASALIGATVAMFSAWLTNRANNKLFSAQRAHEIALRAQDLRRSRGEELYTLLQQWLNRLQGYYLIKRSVMHGKLTYNDALDIELNDKDKNDTSHVRIEMLVHVYFPALTDKYDGLLQLRDLANQVVGAHKAHYASGNTDGTEFIQPLTSLVEKLEDTAEALSMALLKEIRDA